MPRKNGCPFSVRDWTIEIRSRVSTNDTPEWLPVKGLTSMTYGIDSDTEDGSGADSLWSENYTTKKNGTIGLEGKPIRDIVTGAKDPGQAELDYYALLGGCDGDARLRLADPVGNVTIMDVTVTSREVNPDETSESVSWDMDQVGESENPPYVQVSGVSMTIGGTASTSTSLTAGQIESVKVVIDPADASNQKYAVASADERKVRVMNKDGLSFDIQGVTAGAETVDIVVRTLNGNKTARLTVTVTE